MSDKKDVIVLESLDGKKKLEISSKEILLASHIKNDKVCSKKIIKLTKKNSLIMT